MEISSFRNFKICKKKKHPEMTPQKNIQKWESTWAGPLGHPKAMWFVALV